MGTTPTVLDLFCGAGGLSLGFSLAGFDLICAIDNNPSAIKTYEENLGKHVQLQELSGTEEFPQATVIIGGPPCQGFSSAGRRRFGDERNSLVRIFAEIIAEMRPQAFVFENVEGFLTAENGERVFDLLVPLLEVGYRIHLRKINAANYGVPQHRKRVIAIGGLGWDPTFPKPTHFAFGAPGAHLVATHLPPTPTVIDALSGLPSPSAEPPGSPQGHYARPLSGLDLARVSRLQPGQTMRDLPEELQHESFRRRAHRRVKDGMPTERRGGAPSGIRRLRPDEPSKAITGGARTEFVHPFEDRYLTLRECARIQTFPDDFVFVGNVAEQAQLIGNAVPPRLAEVIAKYLKEDLANKKERKNRGALLSFVATVANGMSPLLSKVTRRVHSELADYVVSEELSLWP